MLMQSLVAPKKFVVSSSTSYSRSPGMQRDGGTRGPLWVKAPVILLPDFGEASEGQHHPEPQSSGSLQIISPRVPCLFLYWLYTEKRMTPSQLINIAHSVFYKAPPGTLHCIPFQHGKNAQDKV